MLLDSLEPPSPPKVGGDAKTKEKKPIIKKEVEVRSKTENKNFFSKLFGKHEKKENLERVSSIASMDAENIRSALGITSEKKKLTVREKFEDKAASTGLEKHDWSKSPDLTELVLKQNKKTDKIKIQSDTEKHFSKLHSEFEDSKTEMMSKADKRKPEVQKAKQKIRSEYEKYQVKLKQHAEEQHKQVSEKAKKHEVSLNRKIAGLNKRVKNLDDREKRIQQKEQKIRDAESELAAKKEKINSQAKIMDEYAKEIKLLDTNFRQIKDKTDKQKAEHDNLKLRIKDENLNLKRVKDQYSRTERDHLARIKKMQTDLARAYSELDRINQRSEQVLSTLEKKQALLDEKIKKNEQLVSEEKKMLEILKDPEFDAAMHAEVVPTQTLSEHEEEFQPHMAEQAHDDTSLANEYLEEAPIGKPESAFESIHNKIIDCRQLLIEQNFEDVKILYNEIREDYFTSNVDASDSDTLKADIKDLYDEIALKIVSG